MAPFTKLKVVVPIALFVFLLSLPIMAQDSASAAATDVPTVLQSGPGTPLATQFVSVTPCRVADTRKANGPFGGPPIQGGTFRDFAIPFGSCNIPPTAQAYSLNVTVVPPPGGSLGYLTIYPSGAQRPLASLLNSLDGRIKANAAIVQAGTIGDGVRVYVSNTTDVVLDINGYFAPASSSTLAFYPLPPCRVADTRNPDGPLGGPSLIGNQPRDFPVMQAVQCNIPLTAQAYSMNFTAVAHGPLGYLTVWPVGQSQPVVSTLNDLTGTIVANAGIVTAGTGGDINAVASQDTDLIIDINGYFAPPGSGGLSLYASGNCRVLDTRTGTGAFSGEIRIPVTGVTICAPPVNAQAFVLNATVVPVAGLSYLTLWPDGGVQPLVSTLNAVDNAITSNMAIVSTTNGSIDAFASQLTQLVLDTSSYFAP